MAKKIVHGPDVVKWVEKRTGGGNLEPAIGFGIEDDGQLIGGAVFNDYNKASMQIHTAADRPDWLTREFLWMIFDWAFNQAAVNVLISMAGEKNQRAIKFGLGIGFKQVYEIPDAHPEGKWLVRTMRREDCKWLDLGKRYG